MFRTRYLLLGSVILALAFHVNSQTCTNDMNCNNGTCINATVCECNLQEYIGPFCNESFTVKTEVSSSVLETGEQAVFKANVSSPNKTSLTVKTPKNDIRNLTSEDDTAPFIFEYSITSVDFIDVGDYIFTAHTIYSGKSYEISAISTITYVLTVAVSTEKNIVYFEEGSEKATIEIKINVNDSKSNDSKSDVSVVVKKNDDDTESLEPGESDTLVYNVSDKITSNDNGTYLFTVNETYGDKFRTESVSINVIVEVPVKTPNISNSTEHTLIDVKRGVLTILVCTEHEGIPDSVITWTGPQMNVIFESGAIYQNGGNLTFNETSYDDNGTYTCTAKNKLTSTGEEHQQNISVTINVQGTPEFVSANSTMTIKEEENEFSCTFDGNPTPGVIWMLNEENVNVSEDEIDVAVTDDENKYYRRTSKLIIKHSTRCLGKSNIICLANNVLGDGDTEKKFTINDEPYDVYKDSYIIFSRELKTFQNADIHCNTLGGHLVDIRSDEEQNKITEIADNFSFDGFYIGYKFEKNMWTWRNDSANTQTTVYDNWGNSDPISGCAINKKNNGVWSWIAVNCSKEWGFSCKVQASKFPSELAITIDKCDGTKASAMWKADGDFDQFVATVPSSGKQQTVGKGTTEFDFEDLLHGTEYTLKVETRIKKCVFHPYAEATFKTAFEKALPPNVTVNSTTCEVAWSYPDERQEEISFKLVISETPRLDTAGETQIKSNVTIDSFSSSIKLTPYSLYNITLQTLSCIGNSDQVSKTCTTDPGSSPPEADILAIVLPIVIIILLIVIVIAGIFLWKRRQLKAEQQPEHSQANTDHAHVNAAFADNVYENVAKDTSIAAENLRSTYKSKHADDNRLFREEYRALATEVSELSINYSYAMAPEVRNKNRFSNIHPANENRVVLRKEGTNIYSDYINASYLDGYRHARKFVAAQGPLVNTIGDFWYMIWEQESTVIVMLTKVDENGRRKCEKYWPDDQEQKTFDNLIVKSISNTVFGPILKRAFLLSNPNQSGKTLMVEQFQFLTWPDHGVPVTTSALFNLRRMAFESQGNNPSPMIVHCSAGVGRTGTFVVFDYLCHQMERESKVDVYGTVLAMRKKRREIVQTVEQYGFLHKLMLEKHLFRFSDMKTTEFGSAYGSPYESVDDDDGFYNLSIVSPFTANICEPVEAFDKIRDMSALTYEHSKVVIRMRPSEEKPLFINASYIQTYSSSESFIACQSPVESGIEDFWRVVLDNNVTTIVMLSKLYENDEEHCSRYWPEHEEIPSVFGDVTVSLLPSISESGYTVRMLRVDEKVLHLRRSQNVMQLQYEEWKNDSVPTDASTILDMISKAQANRKSSQGTSAPVLVHCRDGSGRTGTFCAIVNLIERLKIEDRIDIFRTVKDLRDMRPLMVRTLEQYRFCGQAVREYLDSFQLYANFK